MSDRPIYDSSGARVRFFGGPAKRRAKSTKPRQTPEADLQGSLVKYLNWALPERILWTATLNGAHLSQRQRMRMKEAGMRRGISDIVLCDPGRGAFFLEVKPPRGAMSAGHRQYRSLTPEQQQWADALGPRWQTCHSLHEVEAALLFWGIKPVRTVEQANRYNDLGGEL